MTASLAAAASRFSRSHTFFSATFMGFRDLREPLDKSNSGRYLRCAVVSYDRTLFKQTAVWFTINNQLTKLISSLAKLLNKEEELYRGDTIHPTFVSLSLHQYSKTGGYTFEFLFVGGIKKANTTNKKKKWREHSRFRLA